MDSDSDWSALESSHLSTPSEGARLTEDGEELGGLLDVDVGIDFAFAFALLALCSGGKDLLWCPRLQGRACS